MDNTLAYRELPLSDSPRSRRCPPATSASMPEDASEALSSAQMLIATGRTFAYWWTSALTGTPDADELIPGALAAHPEVRAVHAPHDNWVELHLEVADEEEARQLVEALTEQYGLPGLTGVFVTADPAEARAHQSLINDFRGWSGKEPEVGEVESALTVIADTLRPDW